jgi:transcription elongation GreA/GreB family factor
MQPDLRAAADGGDFAALEALWLEQVESDPLDSAFFLDALLQFLHAGQEARAASLLPFLLEAQAESGNARAELEFLKPALRAWPQSSALRTALFESLRRAYADRPSLDRLLQHFKVAEAAEPQAALAALETWLQFDVGRPVLMPQRGLGRVAEINPSLGVLRVDFPTSPRLSLKLAEALKLLTALEDTHFLVEKSERSAVLQALAEADPGAILEKIFASAARPLALSELREYVTGVVPEERWTSWWKRASADSRLSHSAGKRPTYWWSASSDEADAGLRRTFEGADARHRLDLARKHAGRSAELGRYLAAGVTAVAQAARTQDPSLALEAALTLEKLPGATPAGLEWNPAALLAAGDPVPLVAGVEERGLRERALQLLREQRADWPELYARLLRAEADTRTLALLYDALGGADGEALRTRTVDDVLARPHTAPRLFVWLCREAAKRPELDARADWSLLRKLLDAHTQEAFRNLRAPLRELFDDNALGEQLAARLERDQAEQLLAILGRELGLDEHRKERMRSAVMLRHPEFREAVEEVLYTTASGLDRKRAEFERITRVDIPRNAEEIRKAAAHGDLSENYEYKAARERQEMLSSRAKTLHDELRRARAFDPATIDASRVRVGTCVTLTPASGGVPRTLTILGPWDADPASGIVSYLAPAVQPLLGRACGETVRFLDADCVITGIEAWRES